MPRRLEEEEEDEPEYPDVWLWSDEKWEKLIKNKTDIKKDTYPPINCSHPAALRKVVDGLMLIHQMSILRDLLTSTTGAFILTFLGLVFCGTAYLVYYLRVMKGNQKRWRVLEPAQLWIFILDYALIGFMTSCTKVIAHGRTIHLLALTPPHWSVIAFCITSIVLYPVCFVMWVFWRLSTLITQKKLVYDNETESWTDPKCTAMLVTLKPKVPGYIPLLPQLITNHIRSCVPVLDVEGKELKFGKGEEEEEEKKEPDTNGSDEKNKEEEDDGDEADMPKVQEPAIDTSWNEKRKAERLKREREEMKKEKERDENHKATLDRVLKEAKAESGNKPLLEQSCPPWLHKDDKETSITPVENDVGSPYTVISLYDLSCQNWQSEKGRKYVERLDDEETFAMMQFIRTNMREEERLLKYNILRVEPQDGYLKPREPMKPDDQVTERYQNKYAGDNWWLNNMEDYEEKEGAFDHNPWLEQFTAHNYYIENTYGERLVYTGDDNLGWLGWAIPGGRKGGKLDWLSEPEEGWKDWETNTLGKTDRESKTHLEKDGESNTLLEKDRESNTLLKTSRRYADKWQWISYDKWEEPWYGDEADEAGVKVLGFEIKKESIFFYKEITHVINKFFKTRVPFTVDNADKLEIRKYVWAELMKTMDMKLKIMWASCHHPKYYREQSLAKMALTSFHEAILKIEIATPNREVLLKHEMHHVEGGKHELLDFTIMKYEDMYPWDKEPWWGKCDQPKDGELRVMFNHTVFWAKPGDQILEEAIKNDDLVPHNGYNTSPYFNTYPNEEFGFKRFGLLKPDGTETEVQILVQMQHILPLMRYTDSFKLSVPVSNLELANKASLNIIIGEAKLGQQWKYAFERLTTLISIAILSTHLHGHTGHITVCCAILLIELITFGNKMHSATVARSKKDDKDDDNPEDEMVTIKKVEAGDVKEETPPEVPKSRKRIQEVLSTFSDVDVSVYFLRCVVMCFLLVAMLNGIAPAICAVICIFVASSTMVYMNIACFKDQIADVIKEQKESLTSLYTMLWTNYVKGMNFLSGENPLGIEFITFDTGGGSTAKADKIGLMVPELGITFQGEPQIDPMLPMEEQRAMEMTKKMAFYVHNLEGHDDNRPKCIRDHERYQHDIVPSLNVALGVGQMMLRQAIPQIMATLQCVNHSGSKKISRTQYDSFLTLFKPEDWEPEFEKDENKVQEMLSTWEEQVKHWFLHELGATETDRTNTRKIREQLHGMLTEECTGKLHRDISRIVFHDVQFQQRGDWRCKDLIGKAAYVIVYYDTELMKKQFPTERASNYARITDIKDTTDYTGKRFDEGEEPADGNDFDRDSHYYKCEFDCMLDVPVPLNVTKLRFSLWAQTEDRKDELICFSSEVDVKALPMEKKHNVLMHTRWSHSGKHLIPTCGEDRDPEDVRREAERKKEEDELKTEWQRKKERWWANFTYALTLQCIPFFRGMTDEKKKATRAVLKIKVQTMSKEDEAEDVKTVTAVKNVIEGDSAMNLFKLVRHMDRWIDLGKFFGVYLGPEDLEALKKHMEKIKRIKREFDENPAVFRRAGNKPNEDPSLEEKKRKLEKNEVRRQIADDAQMEECITNLESDIVRLTARMDRQAKAGINPEPHHHLLERKISGKCVWRAKGTGKWFSCCGGQKIEVFGATNTQNALLDQLRAYQEAQNASAKQILHYVVMSEHLKPSKNWRPDAISPHVAYLVTNEYDDVPLVGITAAFISGMVTFNRELKAESTEPVIVNGRLCFKAEGTEAQRITPEHTAIFLYWDGQSRWVISPERGIPPPYGIRGQNATNFLWVKDNKATPDLIQETWHTWRKDPNGQEMWTEDKSIKTVRSLDGGTKDFYLEQATNQMEENKDGDESCCGSFKTIITDAFSEALALFSRHSARKIEPELKDCLVGLTSSYLSFAWKDFNIERLAAFRVFLLKEYGSYELAWVRLTRAISIARPKARMNLVKMFAKTEKWIVEASNAHTNNDNNNNHSSEFKRLRQSSSLESVGEAEKDPFEVPWPEERKARMRSYIMENELKDTLPEGDEEGTYTDTLSRLYEHIAAHVVDRMDHEKDARIEAQEVRTLYEGQVDDEVLIAFRDWLMDHPIYHDFSLMWADLSDDLEIGIDDFAEAIKTDMNKFVAGKDSDKIPRLERAKQMFADLDVQFSGGISLRELMPSSTGTSIAEATESIVQFKIPLRYIKEIREEGHKKAGDGSKSLRFILNPQYENTGEWRAFRLALNPDWEVMPNNESIAIRMSQNFYDLWHQVIQECEMKVPQEFIRYYDGEAEDHPVISGTYMRHGMGIQRWGDGRVFKGNFMHHLYDGHGALYASADDYAMDRMPLYDGEWSEGKRHGRGMLQWEQETHEAGADTKSKATKSGHTIGIHKVYNGEFRDDLFHGQGRLYMGKAQPARATAKKPRPGYVSAGRIKPESLVSFEGTFESSWEKVDAQMRKENETYKKDSAVLTNEDGEPVKCFDLQKLTKLDKHKNKPKYKEFFGLDAKKVQRAGQPLPDLAMAFYRQRNRDTMHIKEGTAKYADGTEYMGPFKDGRPHGQEGVLKRMEQNERAEYSRELATYTGSFMNGERCGKGRYTTTDGLEYEGEWAMSMRNGKGKQMLDPNLEDVYGYTSYEGQWKDDMRHGHGEMFFGDKGCFVYVGPFVDDAREGLGKVYLLPEKQAEIQKGRRPSQEGGLFSGISRITGLTAGGDADKRILIMHGLFKQNILQTQSEPAWCRLIQPGGTQGCFYYGQLDKNGAREGTGTMYDDGAAEKDKEFMDCVEGGRPYAKEDPNVIDMLKFTVYSGQWADDKPEGKGVQNFPGKKKGTYTGQFVNGMRHGRGTWQTKVWCYRPIQAKDVQNWRNDKMHGVAIVEDPDTVHVNVIFEDGVGQMPFTDSGAPVTDFERNQLLGSSVRSAKVSINVLSAERRGGIAGSKPPELAKGMEDYGMVNIQRILASSAADGKSAQLFRRGSLGRQGSLRSTGLVGSGALVKFQRQRTSGGEGEELALIREPTDLNLPDEDICITGGTLDNEVLNGYYFKMSGTFGITIYRLVKRTGYLSHVNERFLYRDAKTSCWVIGPVPLHGLAVSKGCAFVEDDDRGTQVSSTPSDCSKGWYVWHPQSKAMKHFGTESDDELDKDGKPKKKKKKAPVDEIVATSTVGFEVFDSVNGVSNGLFLRLNKELYSRPVYEIQTGGMFMYWLEHEGTLELGTQADHAPSEAKEAKALYAVGGFWIIATELGDSHQGRSSLAYVEDSAVTPDQIGPHSTWHCRIREPPPLADVSEALENGGENGDHQNGDNEAQPRPRKSLVVPQLDGLDKLPSPRASSKATPRGSLPSARDSTPQRTPQNRFTEKDGSKSFIVSMTDFDGDQFDPCSKMRLEIEHAVAKGGELIVQFDPDEEVAPFKSEFSHQGPLGAGAGLDDTEPLLGGQRN